MIIYIVLFIVSVFVSSVSQIILKSSANTEYTSKFKEYFNAKVIIAYSMFFISSFLTLYAYKGVPYSLGPILESLGYIFVTILGFLILKEKVSRSKIIGLCVIILGIIIFNI